jgi:hypothetical protein
MPKPTSDSYDRSTYYRITWRGVLVSYAMAAAIPVLLWAGSDPAAAALALAGAAGAFVAARYARRVARCVDQCRGVAFDLPGRVRVTVAWTEACDPN